MDEIRLIDANALRKDIHTSYSNDLGILEHIDNAPTVDAQPAKWGRWELCIERFMTSIYACSVCRSKFGIPSDLVPESFYCYCPRCGARMEVDKDEQA